MGGGGGVANAAPYICMCIYIYINNVIEQPSFASDVDVENQDKNGVFDPHLHLGLSEPMKWHVLYLEKPDAFARKNSGVNLGKPLVCISIN